MAGKRKRRKFTQEFKADAVKYVEKSGKSIGQVAEDLDLTESALRNLVNQSNIDAGEGPGDALTTDDKDELRRLRRENKQLRMEREILKKAAAFFAKESS